MKRTALKRRTPLRPRSAKGAQLAVKRRAFVADLLSRRPRCEFPVRVHASMESGLVVTICGRTATDVHEKLTRGRGGSILDEDNCTPVCRWHHDFIHDHPEWAEHAGLLRASWSVRKVRQGT